MRGIYLQASFPDPSSTIVIIKHILHNVDKFTPSKCAIHKFHVSTEYATKLYKVVTHIPHSNATVAI